MEGKGPRVRHDIRGKIGRGHHGRRAPEEPRIPTPARRASMTCRPEQTKLAAARGTSGILSIGTMADNLDDLCRKNNPFWVNPRSRDTTDGAAARPSSRAESSPHAPREDGQNDWLPDTLTSTMAESSPHAPREDGQNIALSLVSAGVASWIRPGFQWLPEVASRHPDFGALTSAGSHVQRHLDRAEWGGS